jgi:MSHA biogenesis protein MshJ
VEIQGVRTLAAEPVSEVKADAGTREGAANMYRHGIELTVAGQYLDLLNYLAAVEKLPVKIFWGGLSIDATQYPRSLLKLTVYTLSPEKKWLQI